MSTLLRDFATNEAGWEQVEERFALAIRQLTERAAMAVTHDDHTEARGQLLGWLAARALIAQIRRENQENSR